MIDAIRYGVALIVRELAVAGRDSFFRWNGGRLGRRQFWIVFVTWWACVAAMALFIFDETRDPSDPLVLLAWPLYIFWGVVGFYHFWVGGTRRLRDAGEGWLTGYGYLFWICGLAIFRGLWLMTRPTATDVEIHLRQAGMDRRAARLEAQRYYTDLHKDLLRDSKSQLRRGGR